MTKSQKLQHAVITVMEQAAEQFVRHHLFSVSSTVVIDINRGFVDSMDEEAIYVPYVAYTHYTTKRNYRGGVVGRQYNGCRRIDIYLEGIYNLALQNGLNPVTTMENILRDMTDLLLSGVDPSWDAEGYFKYGVI